MKDQRKASRLRGLPPKGKRSGHADPSRSGRKGKYQGLGILLGAIALLGGWTIFLLRDSLFNGRKLPESQPRAAVKESVNSSQEFAPPATSSTEVSNLNARTDALQKQSRAADLNARANELLSSGDALGAIRAFKQALLLTPDDEDVHYNLGLAYVQAGQGTNAETEYREALRLLPDYPEVHNNLGNLLLHSGRLEEAEKEFTEAINQMPDYSKAHNNLGIVRQKQKRLEEALACFQKAVLYESNYWQAHFNLANAYLAQSNLNQAIPELKETLRINPSFQTAQRVLDKLSGDRPATTSN